MDENGEIIGYEYIKTPYLIQQLNQGVDAKQALKNATAVYGRFNEGFAFIDPRGC